MNVIYPLLNQLLVYALIVFFQDYTQIDSKYPMEKTTERF